MSGYAGQELLLFGSEEPRLAGRKDSLLAGIEAAPVPSGADVATALHNAGVDLVSSGNFFEQVNSGRCETTGDLSIPSKIALAREAFSRTTAEHHIARDLARIAGPVVALTIDNLHP